MKDGQLVVIFGKIDDRIREYDQEELVFGTYIGKTFDNRVVVLLEDGILYSGAMNTIAPAEEQSEVEDDTQQTGVWEE